MKFKRGDEVRVLDSCSTGGWVSKVGNVSADRLFFNRLLVVFNDCAEKYFKEDDLELITEEETSMKFKVGDTVKILNNDFDNRGKVGIIKEISGTIMIYCVEFTSRYGNGVQWSNESDLELVKDNYKSLKEEYKSLIQIQTSLINFEEVTMRTVRSTRAEIARNNEALAELELKILDAAKQ